MEGSMLTVLCYSFMWYTLYFTLCLVNSKRSYEWHCRTVTAIHATTISFISMWSGFVQGPWPFTDCGGPNTPLQAMCIEICLGYFLFDLTWCLYFRSEGFVMLLHHICSILAMTVATVTGNYGTEMNAAIFGSELSNPLLQSRWFIRELGHYNSLLGDVIDCAFMLTFGFLRIIVGSALLYSYFQQSTDFVGRFSGTVLYGISWIFWINIMQYGMRKYQKKSEQRKLLKAGSKAHGMGDASNINGHLKEDSSVADIDEGNTTCDSSKSDHLYVSNGRMCVSDIGKASKGTAIGKSSSKQTRENGLELHPTFGENELLAHIDPIIN